MAVDNHKLKSTLHALILLCKEEGFSALKVQKIINKTKLKATGTYMKIVSRLLCNGNDKLKVMPYCFERWRQWLKYRKILKYWLQYTQNYLDPWRRELAQAFKTWKTYNIQLEKGL